MKYKAPAVHQAIETLELLIRKGPLSLTGIANETGFSKATLLRLLETMEAHAWVNKTADNKAYEAQVVIGAKNDPGRLLEQHIQNILNDLCRKINHTVEWYQLHDTYSVIVLRCEAAERRVSVRAKLGFRRVFSGELEAVNRVAMASGQVDCKANEPTGGYYCYCRSGELTKISLKDALSHVSSVKKDLTTYDREWNDNGIRRHAAGVKNSKDELTGILAAAISFTPQADSEIETINQHVKAAAKKIEAVFVRFKN